MKYIIFVLSFLFSINVWATDITVSILPQKFIVQYIAQNKAEINLMVPYGADPHTYAPKVDQIKRLSKSDAYFTIGFPIEKNMITQISKSIDNLTVIEMNSGISMIHGHHHDEYAEHGEHDMDNTDDHIGDELDPHVWTSPANMIKIADNTLNGLILIDPDNATFYKINYNIFINKIKEVDKKFINLFAQDNSPKSFMVYHPTWGYFARDYGLTQYSIEVDGKSPKAADLKKTIQLAKSKKIKYIIIQPQQSRQAADIIAKETGAKVIAIDTLTDDWFKMMDQMYKAMSSER